MAEILCGLLAVLLVVVSLGAVAEPPKVGFDDDGMVLLNGKRTLIIGSYYAAKSDRPLAELAEAGFNLIRTGAAKEDMDKAAAAGLVTWTGVGKIDVQNRETSVKALGETVDRIKEHPALAFIETEDEPAWTWLKAEQRVPWQTLKETYDVIKARDPNHLVYTNQAPTNLVKTLREYNAATDVVACDIYPVTPGGVMSMFALFADGYQGDLNNEHISQVGEYVDKMRQVTGPNRPLLMVLQAFAWEALVQEKDTVEKREEKMLFPSYSQSRFMAFQSIIKGANGIIYWGSDFMPQPSDEWTGIKKVTAEISGLSKPLTERTAGVKVAADYIEMGHSVDDGVQILAKESDGKLYLFTCNADKNTCKAVLSGFKEYKTCAVLGENRSVPVENDTITDTWKRFSVHVYELSK